jgi:hypothetical protein
MTDYKAMTARELLEALRAIPDHELDLEVETEGCDFFGDVAKVEVRRKYKGSRTIWARIVLRRVDGDMYNEEDES